MVFILIFFSYNFVLLFLHIDYSFFPFHDVQKDASIISTTVQKKLNNSQLLPKKTYHDPKMSS